MSCFNYTYLGKLVKGFGLVGESTLVTIALTIIHSDVLHLWSESVDGLTLLPHDPQCSKIDTTLLSKKIFRYIHRLWYCNTITMLKKLIVYFYKALSLICSLALICRVPITYELSNLVGPTWMEIYFPSRCLAHRRLARLEGMPRMLQMAPVQEMETRVNRRLKN